MTKRKKTSEKGPLRLSKAQLKLRLTPEQYHVTQEGGTEPWTPQVDRIQVERLLFFKEALFKKLQALGVGFFKRAAKRRDRRRRCRKNTVKASLTDASAICRVGGVLGI